MRPITDILREIRRGQAVDLASRLLADVVKGVIETGNAGEVSIKIKVKPDKENGAYEIVPSVACKRPVPDLAAGVFFADKDGNLIREDPRQTSMFKAVEDEPQSEAV